MHALMSGMFWSGLFMSVPPVVLSVGVIVYLLRQQSRESGKSGRSED